jgi:hypothetical protein
MLTPTRAALHGTVTAVVVVLRVLASIAEVSADVLGRIADVIAAGRGVSNGPTTSSAAGAAQGSLLP